MRVVIRAFNADGYHKDIAIMSERQVCQFEERIDEDCSASTMLELMGVGVGIEPSKFPEVVRFEIVIQEQEHGKSS
jgi:hypothetical protein